MEVVFLLVVIYFLAPLYYGFLSKNGAAASDMAWATIISLALCAGIFMSIISRKIGYGYGVACIGLAITLWYVFFSPKRGDDEDTKEAKNNIKNCTMIFSSILAIIVIFLVKHYKLHQ